MASRIIYLEVDDEITSAATRIRTTEADRIAVVLPYGSRVATSRINFRLLSRDAMTHDKRLSIVSADAATRALAVSAGLPVFASVAEYESSLTGVDDRAAAADTATAVEAGTPPPGPPTAPADTQKPARARAPEPARAPASPAAATGVAATGMAATTLWGDEIPVETARTPVRRVPTPTLDGVVAGPPSARPVGRGRSRAPLAVGLAILALAVLVAGVGAYLLLPSATIAVTPQTERIPSLGITVIADPAATAPDPASGVIPASQIVVPVTVTQTFPATGTRVEQTPATGTVRFENLDFTSSNTIVKGSIVRTADDVRFQTDESVTLRRAELVGVTIHPSAASVKVTAVDSGVIGNVDRNRITRVPNNESSLSLRVTNPEPTTGGTHVEFQRVVQEDVDGAMAALDAALRVAFAEQLTDPALATGGATVIAETATVGEATPSVDPATFVGQEVPTFDLTLSAEGTVTAVDAAPVRAIAESRLRAAVKPNYELVEGSTEIQVGPATVVGGRVQFEATASADQIALLDADTLKRLVLGKPLDEARSLLAPYGTVELSAWPEWVGSIPTFESRVALTVGRAVQIETPAPSTSSAPGSTP